MSFEVFHSLINKDLKQIMKYAEYDLIIKHTFYVMKHYKINTQVICFYVMKHHVK